MNAKTESTLLRPSQASHRLGICTQTLYNWRDRGQVLMVKLPNGRYGVPLEELERLQTITTEAAAGDE
jgi:predicted site-specific integrase-resolvase